MTLEYHQVIQKHWKDHYQDFREFKDAIFQEIEPYLKKEEQFDTKIDGLINKLVENLSSLQKSTVLNLVGDVMAADGIMTLDESKLFATFMGKLGIRIS